MRRGRVVFWSISGAVIAAGVGFYLWLQFVYLRPVAIPADPNIGANEQARMARDDIPPDPWEPADMWWRQTTIEAFDRVNQGKRWPCARRAVVAFGADISGDPPRTSDEDEDALAAAETAGEYDCTDPLVVYIRGRYLRNLGIPGRTTEGIRLTVQAADGMKSATGYPAFLRCLIILENAQATTAYQPAVTKVSPEKLRAYIDSAAGLFPEVAKDLQIPDHALHQIVEVAGRLARITKRDRMELLEPLFAAMEKAGQSKSKVLGARGEALTTYAWDARGGGWAAEVTEAGWRGFKERLIKAREALSEAWELDNNNSYAAACMIAVCMGDGSERPEMERWFKRSIDAYPGNYNACSRKMLYLNPKWGGSVEQMMAFGRELTQTSTDPLAVRVPITLVDTHWNFAESVGQSSQPHPDYFAKSPDAWNDISGVYETYLKRVPSSRFHRTRYAVIAAWAGKWDVADAQFKQLGEKYSRKVVPEGVVRALRDQAKAKAVAARSV